MIVIAAAAIYGAVLGFSMRPGLRAILYAGCSLAAFQYILIGLSQAYLHSPGLEAAAWLVQAYAGSKAQDMIGPTTAATAAAAVTALLSAITQSDEQRRRVRRISRIEN